MHLVRKSNNYQDYLGKAGTPSRAKAIKAKCSDCMNQTREDCEIAVCPLYAWQPYKKLAVDYSWIVDGRYAWHRCSNQFVQENSALDSKSEGEKEQIDVKTSRHVTRNQG